MSVVTKPRKTREREEESGMEQQQPNLKVVTQVQSWSVVGIEFPVADVAREHYVSRHIDLALDHRQSIALKCLREGMIKAGARLSNGRPVASAQDVVRFMLELVAVQVSEQSAISAGD